MNSELNNEKGAADSGKNQQPRNTSSGTENIQQVQSNVI